MSEQPPLFPMPQATTTSDDYWTPKWVFDALRLEFDLDVACPPQGPPNTPTQAFYTQETDGLSSPWWGTVWMNPPYSNPSPWVAKWLLHGDGCALLPTGGGKWCSVLWQSEAQGVWLGRVAFGPLETGTGSQNIVLWALGDKCVEALNRSGLGRVR